jgi:hypothetical protein
MRLTQSLACLTLAALSAAVPVAPAHATALPTVDGALCGLDSSSGTAEPTTQAGTLSGGPVVAYDASAPTIVANPYIVCSVQVGGTGHHADPDAAQVITWHPGYATVLPPTPVAFQAQAGEQVFLCSEIWIATSDGHFSIYYNEATGTFSMNPATATCQLAETVPGLTLSAVTYHAPAHVVVGATT